MRQRSTPAANSAGVNNGRNDHLNNGSKKCGLNTKGAGLSIILCAIICICIILVGIFVKAGENPPSSRNRPDLTHLGDLANKLDGDVGKASSGAQGGVEGIMHDLAGGKLASMAQGLIQGFNSYVKAIADDSADDAIEQFKKRQQKAGGGAGASNSDSTSATSPDKLGETYFTGKCTGCPASWYQNCNPGDKILGHRGCNVLGCELQCQKVLTSPPTPAPPPTPPTTAPTPAPTTAAACTNPADQGIWTSKGKAGFSKAMEDLGFSCMGAEKCMSDDMVKKFGYSQTCGNCFGALGSCTKKFCMFKCMGGATKGCTKCTRKNCLAPFSSCSGIAQSDVPKSAPPKGS
jgi:hypothetical protein